MRVSQGGNTTKPSKTSIADLRAQIQAKPVKGVKLPSHKIPAPPPPPKPKKQKQQVAVDRRDEAAERAERLAQQSHSTSLLQGKKVKTLLREEDKPKGGTWSFMIQLTFVIAVCAAGAYIAADPSVLDKIPWAEIKNKLKLDQFGIT